MPSTLKLQSPAYDGAGLGESLLLPGAFVTENASSTATVIAAPGNVRHLADFAQIQEPVTIAGTLTERAAIEAGFDNVTHFRDGLRRLRSVWPLENGVSAGSNWNQGTLPSDERDTEARGRGKARLIRDKSWNSVTGQFVNLFLYGAVLAYQFGPILASTLRTRIPYAVTFIVSDVKVGVPD